MGPTHHEDDCPNGLETNLGIALRFSNQYNKIIPFYYFLPQCSGESGVRDCLFIKDNELVIQIVYIELSDNIESKRLNKNTRFESDIAREAA